MYATAAPHRLRTLRLLNAADFSIARGRAWIADQRSGRARQVQPMRAL